MLLLVIGILIWALAHWFKRLAPERRARMGNGGRGVVSLLLLGSIILMVIGYRNAASVAIWTPPDMMVHVNNLLMLAAFFIFGTSMTKGRLRGWTRHPMLISVKVWAVAHLLVNGDLASILLFGSMLIWAGVTVMLINRAEPAWERPEPGPASKDVLLLVITLVTFSFTAGIHYALGYWPFPA